MSLTSCFHAVLSPRIFLSLYPSSLMISNAVEMVLCRVDCGESDFGQYTVASRILEISRTAFKVTIFEAKQLSSGQLSILER